MLRNEIATRHPSTRGLSLAALLFAFAACGPGEPPAAPDTYQTRGMVRQLPEADRPGSALYIHHEAIPEFKDAGGEVVGMESMAMPFAVADPAMLEGLAAGDRIAFELEMRWQGKDPLLITRLEKLPPETRLAFDPEPAGDEAGEDESERPEP